MLGHEKLETYTYVSRKKDTAIFKKKTTVNVPRGCAMCIPLVPFSSCVEGIENRQSAAKHTPHFNTIGLAVPIYEKGRARADVPHPRLAQNA